MAEGRGSDAENAGPTGSQRQETGGRGAEKEERKCEELPLRGHGIPLVFPRKSNSQLPIMRATFPPR